MTPHVLDDALLNEAHASIGRGETWIAVNEVPYFLERGDMYFFKTKEEAQDFAFENYSDVDGYRVFCALSILDVLKQTGANRDLINQKTNEMTQENLQYLKDNLKYLGFGEKLYPQLEKELKAGDPSFQLKLETEINDKAFVAVLNFRKSNDTDRYFFNSYHATLQRKDGEITDQAFYVNKGKGVTGKEAFNLLDGRSVFKELPKKDGTTYNAWVQLDFDKKDKRNNHEVTQFHENYGYNLREAVGKYAVKDLEYPDQEAALLKSLQKGNIQSVTIEKDGTASKMFLEANPQYKSINLYDANFRRIPKESLEQYQSTSKTDALSQTKTAKQTNTDKAQTNKNVNTATTKRGKQHGSDNNNPKAVKELLPQTEGKVGKKNLKI